MTANEYQEQLRVAKGVRDTSLRSKMRVSLLQRMNEMEGILGEREMHEDRDITDPKALDRKQSNADKARFQKEHNNERYTARELFVPKDETSSRHASNQRTVGSMAMRPTYSQTCSSVHLLQVGPKSIS